MKTFSEKKVQHKKQDSLSPVKCGKCDQQFVDKDAMW